MNSTARRKTSAARVNAVRKALWKIALVTSPEAEDAASDLLQSLLSEPVSSYTHVESRQTTIACYLANKPDWLWLRMQLRNGLSNIKRCGLNTAPATISLVRIRREDWAESWKRHFKAIEIGSALLIKPSWIKRKPRRNQAVVVLDPGLSFGTGQHPTTSFCLEQLAGRARQGAVAPSQRLSFLDIGTGSGILAIAAAKLGYRPVKAFDFDPESVRVARENTRHNGVARTVQLFRADLTKLPHRSKTRFDVVCANLISTLLIAERDRIMNRVKPDGVLIVAGILAAEFKLVETAFAQAGLKLIASQTKNEWRSGAFIFRSA